MRWFLALALLLSAAPAPAAEAARQVKGKGWTVSLARKYVPLPLIAAVARNKMNDRLSRAGIEGDLVAHGDMAEGVFVVVVTLTPKKDATLDDAALRDRLEASLEEHGVTATFEKDGRFEAKKDGVEIRGKILRRQNQTLALVCVNTRPELVDTKMACDPAVKSFRLKGAAR